jgi:hypothetical protein
MLNIAFAPKEFSERIHTMHTRRTIFVLMRPNGGHSIGVDVCAFEAPSNSLEMAASIAAMFYCKLIVYQGFTFVNN